MGQQNIVIFAAKTYDVFTAKMAVHFLTMTTLKNCITVNKKPNNQINADGKYVCEKLKSKI